MGEHLLCKQEVIGSNPFASTNARGVIMGRWDWPDRGARGNRFWRAAFDAAGRFRSLAL